MKLGRSRRGPAQASCNQQKQQSVQSFRVLLAHLRLSLTASPRKSKPVERKTQMFRWEFRSSLRINDTSSSRVLVKCVLCVLFCHFYCNYSFAHAYHRIGAMFKHSASTP